MRPAQLPGIQNILDFIGGEIVVPHGLRHIDGSRQREPRSLLFELEGQQGGQPVKVTLAFRFFAAHPRGLSPITRTYLERHRWAFVPDLTIGANAPLLQTNIRFIGSLRYPLQLGFNMRPHFAA